MEYIDHFPDQDTKQCGTVASSSQAQHEAEWIALLLLDMKPTDFFSMKKYWFDTMHSWDFDNASRGMNNNICQNSRQAQSLANSSFDLPLRTLQGRQMAPIQLDSITMLGKKLLVGHTRLISSPILRGRDFWLTAYSILYEKICCLW